MSVPENRPGENDARFLSSARERERERHSAERESENARREKGRVCGGGENDCNYDDVVRSNCRCSLIEKLPLLLTNRESK